MEDEPKIENSEISTESVDLARITSLKKKNLLTALISTLGVVTSACKLAGTDRTTHYRWVREDKDYAAAVDDLDNIALDFAESKLHGQIEAGEVASTIFFLKTKGKRRGYVERVEQEIRTQKPVIIDWSDNDGAAD